MKNKSSIRVCVCAPGSPLTRGELKKGIEGVKSLCAEPVLFGEPCKGKGRLAGPDQVRAESLLRSLSEGKIIVAARGGGGCGRLYPLVKKGLKALRPHEKIFIGSSDCTFIYLFFQALSPQIFLYGPMLSRYGTGEFRGFERKTIKALINGELTFPLVYPGGYKIEKEGREVRGRLDGGNLSILTASLGTPYEWEPRGPVFYLEDVNEPLYRIDRMLTQLSHAGKLQNFRAAIVGRMEVSGRPVPREELAECLMEHLGKVPGRILTRVPTGHGKTQWPFFLGGMYAVGQGIECLDAGGQAGPGAINGINHINLLSGTSQ